MARHSDEPPVVELRPEKIFETLDRHRVQYVVIGGLAVQAHGHLRTTQDVDVVAAVNSENFQRLAVALKELEAELRGVDAHLLGITLDAETLANGANFTLTTNCGNLDIFTDNVPGPSDYRGLRERARVVEVAGTSVAVVGRDDLIALKRAAGRPQDLEDIAALTDPGFDNQL